jgi:hypothetical protein
MNDGRQKKNGKNYTNFTLHYSSALICEGRAFPIAPFTFHLDHTESRMAIREIDSAIENYTRVSSSRA